MRDEAVKKSIARQYGTLAAFCRQHDLSAPDLTNYFRRRQHVGRAARRRIERALAAAGLAPDRDAQRAARQHARTLALFRAFHRIRSA